MKDADDARMVKALIAKLLAEWQRAGDLTHRAQKGGASAPFSIMDINTWEAEHRGSGRTTSLALAYVRLGLDNPGMVIPVHDHHPNGHRLLQHKISDVLAALGIDHRLHNVGHPSFEVLPMQRELNGM